MLLPTNSGVDVRGVVGGVKAERPSWPARVRAALGRRPDRIRQQPVIARINARLEAAKREVPAEPSAEEPVEGPLQTNQPVTRKLNKARGQA